MQSSRIDILLDPLTVSQKAALDGQPFIEGSGATMRLRLMTLPGRISTSRPDAPEIQRFSDGSSFVPTLPSRPLTWEITLDGAHGQLTAAILETLWGQMRVLTFDGDVATTRLWDYSRPVSPLPYTEFSVALVSFDPPQDAITGNPIRYLDGGSVTFLEVV